MQPLGRVIAVLGPTGVGKTDLALALAQSLNGEIVSCDSVQLYRHLDIGSAKPSAVELAMVPHHLINAYDPDYQIDVGVYKDAAEAAIQDILARGKVPVICGGTGMYFNALHTGLFDAPARNDALRAVLEEQADNKGLPALYTELQSCDPLTAAAVEPTDKRRIIRAIEVYRLSGQPISVLRQNNNRLPLVWHITGLNRDRAELYSRIETRVDLMLKAGLIEETRRIIAQFGHDAFALGSIGYRHARLYIDGQLEMQAMTELLKQDTRHYAKRQITWFNKTPGLTWRHPDDRDSAITAARAFIEEATP